MLYVGVAVSLTLCSNTKSPAGTKYVRVPSQVSDMLIPTTTVPVAPPATLARTVVGVAAESLLSSIRPAAPPLRVMVETTRTEKLMSVGRVVEGWKADPRERELLAGVNVSVNAGCKANGETVMGSH